MTTIIQALSVALVDFLWQGTLVAMVLWLLLGALRHRSPNSRYLASASALLVLAVLPLATLVGVVQQVVSTRAVVAGSVAPVLGQPSDIPQTMLPIWLVSDTPHVLWLSYVERWAVPVWSIGVLLCSIRFLLGYRHVVGVHRLAALADDGIRRAVDRLAKQMGIAASVRVVLSTLAHGPGVVGWIRPVILLPSAAAMGLTPQPLEAVLAHELAHIKRHDYLVNLVQSLIEVMFFYHPAVWWVSHQIRVERELCCDDVAVRTCGDPVFYARALTTLATRQSMTTAFTMAATGGPLVRRIRRLLGEPEHEYSQSYAPLLVLAGLVFAAAALNVEWLQAFQADRDQPRFEVASIKAHRANDTVVMINRRGGRVTAVGATLSALIRLAYQVQEFQIVDAPAWVSRGRFDIEATEPDGERPDAFDPLRVTPTREQLMVRSLLRDRFNLLVHRETRSLPVYALVLARRDGRLGPKLHPSALDCRGNAGAPECGTNVAPGFIRVGGRTMTDIATAFSNLTNTGSSLNRLVVDQTTLQGLFDAELRFTPESIPNFGPTGPPPDLPPIDPNGPSIFTAVQEQLGLKLDPQRGPVEVLVIDRVGEPTEN